MQFGNRITLNDKQAAILPGQRINPLYVAQFTNAAVGSTQNTLQSWVSPDKERKLVRPTVMISADPKGLVINMECAEVSVLEAATWFAVQYNATAFNANMRDGLTAAAERWARDEYDLTFVVSESGVEVIPSVL